MLILQSLINVQVFQAANNVIESYRNHIVLLKNMFLVFLSDVPKITSSLAQPHPQLHTFPCGQIAILGLVKLLTSLVYHAASRVSKYKDIVWREGEIFTHQNWRWENRHQTLKSQRRYHCFRV